MEWVGRYGSVPQKVSVSSTTMTALQRNGVMDLKAFGDNKPPLSPMEELHFVKVGLCNELAELSPQSQGIATRSDSFASPLSPLDEAPTGLIGETETGNPQSTIKQLSEERVSRDKTSPGRVRTSKVTFDFSKGDGRGDDRESSPDDFEARDDTDSRISLVSYIGSEDSFPDTRYESATVPMIVRILDKGFAWLEGGSCGVEPREIKATSPTNGEGLLRDSSNTSVMSLRKNVLDDLHTSGRSSPRRTAEKGVGAGEPESPKPFTSHPLDTENSWSALIGEFAGVENQHTTNIDEYQTLANNSEQNNTRATAPRQDSAYPHGFDIVVGLDPDYRVIGREMKRPASSTKLPLKPILVKRELVSRDAGPTDVILPRSVGSQGNLHQNGNIPGNEEDSNHIPVEKELGYAQDEQQGPIDYNSGEQHTSVHNATTRESLNMDIVVPGIDKQRENRALNSIATHSTTFTQFPPSSTAFGNGAQQGATADSHNPLASMGCGNGVEQGEKTLQSEKKGSGDKKSFHQTGPVGNDAGGHRSELVTDKVTSISGHEQTMRRPVEDNQNVSTWICGASALSDIHAAEPPLCLADEHGNKADEGNSTKDGIQNGTHQKASSAPDKKVSDGHWLLHGAKFPPPSMKDASSSTVEGEYSEKRVDESRAEIVVSNKDEIETTRGSLIDPPESGGDELSSIGGSDESAEIKYMLSNRASRDPEEIRPFGHLYDEHVVTRSQRNGLRGTKSMDPEEMSSRATESRKLNFVSEQTVTEANESDKEWDTDIELDLLVGFSEEQRMEAIEFLEKLRYRAETLKQSHSRGRKMKASQINWRTRQSWGL